VFSQLGYLHCCCVRLGTELAVEQLCPPIGIGSVIIELVAQLGLDVGSVDQLRHDPFHLPGPEGGESAGSGKTSSFWPLATSSVLLAFGLLGCIRP
jgi:hypothetical protein